MDMTTQFARQRGWLPDRYWYQLNGRSPEENLWDQRAKMRRNLVDGDDIDTVDVKIRSEVKIK